MSHDIAVHAGKSIVRLTRAEEKMSRSIFASCRTDSEDLRLCAAAIATTAFFIVTPRLALAADQVHDEIQVYNADIAEVGQWVYEQQLNYAFVGQTKPEFPGAFVSKS